MNQKITKTAMVPTSGLFASTSNQIASSVACPFTPQGRGSESRQRGDSSSKKSKNEIGTGKKYVENKTIEF